MLPNIENFQEVLPYAAAVVGAGVGVALEASAQHTVAKNREALTGDIGDIAREQHTSRLRRLGKVVIGPIVFVGAVAGLANGMAWQSEPNTQQVPPHLEVVVDHSAATMLDGGLAAEEINQIVGMFDNKDEVEAHAFIAGGNRVKSVKITDVPTDEPFGAAPLENATLNALEQVRLNEAGAVGERKLQTNGVLILTNGNDVGSARALEAKANANNSPIFIVNVEAEGSKKETVQELKQITKQTEGEYWDADQENIDKVKKTIKKTLTPGHIDRDGETKRWLLRGVAAVLSVVVLTNQFTKRRKMTLGDKLK